MDDILAPVFPPELERLIFEIASINCGRVDVINILLVAKRVHDWSVTSIILPAKVHELLLGLGLHFIES